MNIYDYKNPNMQIRFMEKLYEIRMKFALQIGITLYIFECEQQVVIRFLPQYFITNILIL